MKFLQGLFAKDTPPQLPDISHLPVLAEDGESQVVGESFYKKNFEAVGRIFNAASGEERITEFELRLDPDNPFSQSGKAVGVYAYGYQLGHIPESDSPRVFDAVEPVGDAVKCRGRVYFDDFRSTKPRHSVQLFFAWPPRLNGTAAKSVAFSELDETVQDDLDRRRAIRIGGGGPSLPELQRGDEISPENVRGFELRVLEKVLEPQGITVRASKHATVYVIDKPETWNNRVGLERLLKMELPSVYLEDFFSEYPKYSPNLRLAEAIEDARRWLKLNPDHDEAEISVIAQALNAGHVLLKGHAIITGSVVDGGVSRFGLYRARVLKPHKDSMLTLLEKHGASVFDKLLVVGDVRKDDGLDRLNLSVDGRDICAMYAEQRDYFDMWGRYGRPLDQELVEISWEDDNDVSVRVFSSKFHSYL